MILVNNRYPAVLGGSPSFSLSLEFYVFGFAILGFLGILSTSMTWSVVSCLALGFPGGRSFSEFKINSLGISLCRMLARFARRSSCMVVNSQRRFTLPRKYCQDWSNRIHRMDPLVATVICCLASQDKSFRALMMATMVLNMGLFSEKSAYKKLYVVFEHQHKNPPVPLGWIP